MKKTNKKLFEFEKKVVNTLMESDALTFIQSANNDKLVLDPEKTQEFLKQTMDKIKDLYDESLNL